MLCIRPGEPFRLGGRVQSAALDLNTLVGKWATVVTKDFETK